MRDLLDEYAEAYANRDESLMAMFSDDFTGFAAGCRTITSSRDGWVELTRRDFAQVPGPLDCTVRELVVQQLAPEVFLLNAVADVGVPLPKGGRQRFLVRHVQVRRLEEGEWKIVHSNTSGPVAGGRDEVYPLRELEARNRALESMVRERTDELEQANRELVELSRVDGLTGIANRRWLDEVLAGEWNRARRDATPLAMMMVDIDRFKDYNDRYGHLAGDDCLRAVAEVLQREVGRRAGDFVARFGGEEFAVLLWDADDRAALELAQRLRVALAGARLEHEGSPTGALTVSTGVASIVPDGDPSPEHLIERADTALYEAKRAGRDRVVIS